MPLRRRRSLWTFPLLLLAASMLSGCFLQRSSPAPRAPLFELAPGQMYGPPFAAPISIRLGQSVVRASGSVGPSDMPQGSPAIWEGHALTIEPDRERNRTLFFFVEGDDLTEVKLEFDDLDTIVEHNPGAYLSGEFNMVRWKQEYGLRISAEDRAGNRVSSAIFVNGEDARLEGEQTDTPLRMSLMRLGRTDTRDVRGPGYSGKLHRHPWPACLEGCDPTTQGGALIAFVSGPADTLVLFFDSYPFLATGLSYWPAANYLIVAIPVREENVIEIAALSEAGDLVHKRWDRPGA
jgi:hypothetical protein